MSRKVGTFRRNSITAYVGTQTSAFPEMRSRTRSMPMTNAAGRHIATSASVTRKPSRNSCSHPAARLSPFMLETPGPALLGAHVVLGVERFPAEPLLVAGRVVVEHGAGPHFVDIGVQGEPPLEVALLHVNGVVRHRG